MSAPTLLATSLGCALGAMFALWLVSLRLRDASLERSIGKRRPDYAAYQRRTSAFFPLPPRRL